METINIYEIVADKIRSLEIYQENKTILDAEIIMHKFFIKYTFGTVAGLYFDKCFDKLDHWLINFIEDELSDIQQAESEQNFINKAIDNTIKEIEKNNLNVEVLTGNFNGETWDKETQLKTKFIRSIDYTKISKYTAFNLFLTAIRGGDIYQSKAKKFTPENYFNEPEKLLHFKKYYDAEIGKSNQNYDGILKAYAKDHKCKDAIYKFYNSHKDKIIKLYPLATKLRLFLALLRIEDIPKLYK